MQKTILILGAGTGGIITAELLSKKTGGKAKILLFEKEEKNVFAPSLLWLMTGKRNTAQVSGKTYKLNRNGVSVILGKIEKINPEKISIIAAGKEYRGDFMVISLGTDYLPEPLLDPFGSNFYTLDGAAAIYNQLKIFKGGKIAVLVHSLPFKCPAAPYEAAMLIEDYIRQKGLKEKTTVSIYTPESQPMPVAGKELGEGVRRMLEQKGIEYFPEHQFKSGEKNTLTFSNGKTANFDLLSFTPKHVCPQVILESSLIGKSNWIEVNRHTLETVFQNVYAIGDNTFIPLESGKPLPKAGVFAHGQAETVAENIAGKIKGSRNFKNFNGHGQCFLETGNGKAGYASGNFYASPAPVVKMKQPAAWWHWTKIWFEKYWLYKYF